MRTRPLIGVTLDSEPAGGWSKLPWYALRQNYFDAVIAAGGLPVALPHAPDLAAAYLDEIDRGYPSPDRCPGRQAAQSIPRDFSSR